MYPKVDNFYFLSLKRDWFLYSELETISEDNIRTWNHLKTIRASLNKATRGNYETLTKVIRNLNFVNREDLQRAAKLMYDKAVDEQGFSEVYAEMCAELADICVPGAVSAGLLDFVTFKDNVIHLCQLELEYRTDSSSATETLEPSPCSSSAAQLSAEVSEESEDKMKMMLEEQELVSRGRALGNAKFVGELFNAGVLPFDIVHRCVRYLLRGPDERELECAFKLLETIGRAYRRRHKRTRTDFSQYLVQYFHRMSQMVARLGPEGVSKRVRYKFDDLVDFWRREWKPRDVDLDWEFAEDEETSMGSGREPRVKTPHLWLHV